MVVWDLCLGIVVYFLSSLGGVAIVKFLNYHFCFSSWLVLALLSRATWVLAIALTLCLGEGLCRVTWKQLRIYFVVAVGLSIVEAFNAVSMSVLPGSVYALIKGFDVFWSTVLSWLVLGKSYSRAQIMAVGLILLGIGAIFGLGPPASTHPEATDKALQATHIPNGSVAALVCTTGALLNALLSVITEATLKQTLKEEQERLESATQEQPPSKLALSNEYAMWTSLFSFLVLSLSATVTGQLAQLATETRHLSCDSLDHAATESASTADISLWSLSLVAITISRFSERLCKHWICVRDSAMTFSMVQAARRLSGVLVLAALFGEAFPPSMVTGFFLAAVGFALHAGSSMSIDQTNDTITKDTRQYELVSLGASTEADEDLGDEEVTA